MLSITNIIKRLPYKSGLAVVIAFFIIDILFGKLSHHLNLPERVVDLQSHSSLFYKLDYLKKYKGKKIVFLGDSVVYGRAMEAHGDKNWEKNTIVSKFSEIIKRHNPKQKTLVLNLGMNGALPTDLNELVRILNTLDIDLLVMDVTLRSFSMDFADEANQMSRPWLKNIKVNPNGKIRLIDTTQNFFEYIENILSELLARFSALYRTRDFMHWFVFNNQPSQGVIGIRNKINDFLTRKTVKEEDPLILTLKAKNRHKRISLTDENPQFTAFKNLLKATELAHKKIIVFYATEDQDYMENILDNKAYKNYLNTLEKTIKTNGPNVVYIPPQKLLKHHYADYVHLNEHGSDFMSKIIFQATENLGIE